jgi:hypothetical protein
MQIKPKGFKIDLPESDVFSWPVKIRVRAKSPLKAPRKSPILPASVSHAIENGMVLRTLELSRPQPCRRAPAAFELATGAPEKTPQ